MSRARSISRSRRSSRGSLPRISSTSEGQVSHSASSPGTTASSDTASSRLGTIPDTFRSVASQHPDRVAYRDQHRSITYREFDDLSNAAANGLLALTDERPVVVVAPTNIESVATIFGALKAGRLVAPLDPRWPVEQWLEVTRRLDAQLVVPDESTLRALPDGAAEHALLTSSLLDGDPSDPQVEVDPEAPAFVFFTSGSTGAPKGTLVGHEMPLRALGMFEGVLETDRLALLAPLSFITGSIAATAVVLVGSAGHFFDASTEDLASLPTWLDDHGVTIMALSVTIIGMIAKAANDEGRTIESLRFVGHGGEAGSAQHFADARRAFPNAEFRHSYGMTETGPVSAYVVGTTIEPTDGPIPVGYPWPWVQVEIVDEDGRAVPDGDEGEIWVTSRQVAFG
jgi:acyl-CoA synthetase (AMP-forming)/AMP-acid ligase II